MKLISRNNSNEKTQNPWEILKSLNNQQRITFAAAFLGWTLDAFDYFIVVLTIPYIAKEFEKEEYEITASITTTLCFRPVGAVIFGLLADRYGRRYPLMLDIILYSAMELASGFAPSFSVFIVLRAIFGVAMGGEWGLGAALAMEILPPESRGLFSGILQQGYATGFLLATLLFGATVENIGWRATFWIGSFPAVLTVLLRFFVPESPVWEAQHDKEDHAKEDNVKENNVKESMTKTWVLNTKLVLKHHWKSFVYCVLLMACFNFLSHGTQDLYPTFLKSELGFKASQVTIILVIANIGAIIGGTICGYVSQLYGRKITVIVAVFLAACFIPLYILPTNIGLLSTGAFALFFFVQGAWGVVPAHLNELSPPEFRGTFPGLTYQLGNLISSSAAQIEARLGDKFRKNEKANYGLIIAILSLIVMFCLIILTFFGKENKDANFIKQAEQHTHTINNERNIKREHIEAEEKGEQVEVVEIKEKEEQVGVKEKEEQVEVEGKGEQVEVVEIKEKEKQAEVKEQVEVIEIKEKDKQVEVKGV